MKSRWPMLATVVVCGIVGAYVADEPTLGRLVLGVSVAVLVPLVVGFARFGLKRTSVEQVMAHPAYRRWVWPPPAIGSIFAFVVVLANVVIRLL
jgi:hypothetical protein